MYVHNTPQQKKQNRHTTNAKKKHAIIKPNLDLKLSFPRVATIDPHYRHLYTIYFDRKPS